LRAGPRDKSKKGTVTGTVRFKLRRDPKTGEFKQVREDEGDSIGVGAFGGKRKQKDEDEDFNDGEGGGSSTSRPIDQKTVEDDEEDLFAELEENERIKKMEEREAIEKQKRDRKEDEERELMDWEKEMWAERWRAENTPGFSEWEAVSFQYCSSTAIGSGG
jgi:hypothetical protein